MRPLHMGDEPLDVCKCLLTLRTPLSATLQPYVSSVCHQKSGACRVYNSRIKGLLAEPQMRTSGLPDLELAETQLLLVVWLAGLAAAAVQSWEPVRGPGAASVGVMMVCHGSVLHGKHGQTEIDAAGRQLSCKARIACVLFCLHSPGCKGQAQEWPGLTCSPCRHMC